ncbi:MAG: DinB family protein [Mongoliibacter sp.]|uniref:DinB family protein n=1 Tax=Mongoliibacter sp. TaxID=2022438 RepID=UPI0012F29832|nr:DinB family protein [Mongoliibacter sp.]TVP51680.1 MAG: DinB family protein [Mongoliibacter sp.]
MNWIEELEKVNEETKSTFGDISDDTLNKRPNPSKWSVAENFHHLIKVNESYFPLFIKLQNNSFQAPFIAKFSFFSRLFGNMIFQSVSDGGKKKVKTFPAWEPESNTYQNTISDFLLHQKMLAEKIREMQPFVEQNTIIHSPVNRLIVYPLPQALDIIVAHEWRHLDQAKQALKSLK